MRDTIRVLVVDDSAFMRKVVSDMVQADARLTLAGTAKNGKEAIEKARELNPDVITLDVEMPVMNGLSCLKELQKIRNFPVVMVSSLTTRNADVTIKSLEQGAIDFVTKPSNVFEMADDSKRNEIIEKIILAKNASGAKSNSLGNLQIKPISDIIKDDTIKNDKIRHVVAIGTSTGGPRALQDVIPLIPGNVPAAFLVVQHMPPGFTRSLAERLNSMSRLMVKEAEDGEGLKPGYAYIAPGDYHMTVSGTAADQLSIKLTQDPAVGGHRPSVDVMIESLSRTRISNVTGVIMTGMGKDGSEGIKRLKAVNNGYIIAQDEKSCVVYGMPKAAIATGAVDAVVPLRSIAEEILRNMGVQK